MRQISSKATFLYKRLFPVFWFGILLLIALSSLGVGWSSGQLPPTQMLIVPAIMAVVGYFIMNKLVFDLVDEVFDDGDGLVIRNGGQQERIALSEITNVSYTQFVNPPRVTLSLRNPGQFGAKISFCAPLRFMSYSTSPIVDELITRIDAARSRRP
jgi:hypothetical protein